jgi:hypothetical protein
VTDPITNALDRETDHELVDRLLELHPPKDKNVAALMDEFRADFIDVTHLVVDMVPRSDERTIAIRSIHRACMDTIAAIACNQDKL